MAITDAMTSSNSILEAEYDPSMEFITCKPNVYYHDKIKELCVIWCTRSIRKVAHRLMMYLIAKEGGPGTTPNRRSFDHPRCKPAEEYQTGCGSLRRAAE